MELMSWGFYTIIFLLISGITVGLNAFNLLDSDKEYKKNEGFDVVKDYYLNINYKQTTKYGKFLIIMNILFNILLLFNVWMYQSLLYLIIVLIEFRLRLSIKDYNESNNKSYIIFPIDLKITAYYVLVLFSIYISSYIYTTTGNNYSFINYLTT